MKTLQDALYNWLTIKVVSDEIPEDNAAKETTDLFEDILTTDHQLTNIQVKKEDEMYYVTYEKDGEVKTTRFPVELIESMLVQIKSDPEKYKIYPNE